MAAGGLARRAGAGASRGGGRGRSRQVRGAAGPGPRGEPQGRPLGAGRASQRPPGEPSALLVVFGGVAPAGEQSLRM